MNFHHGFHWLGNVIKLNNIKKILKREIPGITNKSIQNRKMKKVRLWLAEGLKNSAI